MHRKWLLVFFIIFGCCSCTFVHKDNLEDIQNSLVEVEKKAVKSLRNYKNEYGKYPPLRNSWSSYPDLPKSYLYSLHDNEGNIHYYTGLVIKIRNKENIKENYHPYANNQEFVLWFITRKNSGLELAHMMCFCTGRCPDYEGKNVLVYYSDGNLRKKLGIDPESPHPDWRYYGRYEFQREILPKLLKTGDVDR